MRHGSLFSGIGGFDLASEWMGWENVFQIENDPFCNSKLIKNFPNVKRYGDIKEFDGTGYRGLIDILTGGFPCQGFSVAGKQRGKDDPRWLWPQMLRIIREIQPTFIVGENVPGIIKLALEDICASLESEDYDVQPFIIPSASIGAWDKRDRIWIIAYNDKWGRQKHRLQARRQMSEREIEVPADIKSTVSEQSGKTRTGRNGLSNSISNIISKGLQGHSWNDLLYREKNQIRQAGQTTWLRNWIKVASELCGSNARIPHRMDRIKTLGNSVNPYVPFEIFKAIEEFVVIQK